MVEDGLRWRPLYPLEQAGYSLEAGLSIEFVVQRFGVPPIGIDCDVSRVVSQRVVVGPWRSMLQEHREAASAALERIETLRVACCLHPRRHRRSITVRHQPSRHETLEGVGGAVVVGLGQPCESVDATTDEGVEPA